MPHLVKKVLEVIRPAIIFVMTCGDGDGAGGGGGDSAGGDGDGGGENEKGRSECSANDKN